MKTPERWLIVSSALLLFACRWLPTPAQSTPAPTFTPLGSASTEPTATAPVISTVTLAPTFTPLLLTPEVTTASGPVNLTPTEPGPVRIQFEPGAIAAQMSGHLEPFGFQTYVLRALGGQVLRARLLPPPVEEPKAILVIWGADGTVLISDHALATSWEGTFPSTQDYFIEVRANPSTPVDYVLEVVISPLVTPSSSEGGQPQRIQFAPGAVSAQVHGHLGPSQAREYVLRALAGQKMWVRLLPPPTDEPEVILVIRGEDGTVLISDHALATSWEGVLPTTQDYFISVRAHPSRTVDYTLEVVVLSP